MCLRVTPARSSKGGVATTGIREPVGKYPGNTPADRNPVCVPESASFMSVSATFKPSMRSQGPVDALCFPVRQTDSANQPERNLKARIRSSQKAQTLTFINRFGLWICMYYLTGASAPRVLLSACGRFAVWLALRSGGRSMPCEVCAMRRCCSISLRASCGLRARIAR